MGSGIVERLKQASEAEEVDEQLEALLLEAADEIEHLRRLLDHAIEGGLDLIEAKGRA